MAEETITILKVGTDEAVKSIADLRENVKVLKKVLEETQVDTKEGWEQYQTTLEELKVNQNALKDAMYATTGTFEDVTKAAVGAGESYNSLVHRMAALKEEFRATGDAARREDLGKEINKINTELKNLDALQGNFQRNVGNYAGGIKDAFKDISGQIDAMSKAMGAAGGKLNVVKNGFDAFSKSPAIATIGILVSSIVMLTDRLKENETAMAAIKKGLQALQPVMDFFSGILETIAGWLADLITDITEFVTSNGLLNKVIQGVMGVGNAIVQFVIAPFKAVIEAIKVFKEQGIKGLGNAAKAFGQELKGGVSFKENFKAGQQVAETLIAGAKSKKKKVKDTGKDLGKDLADGFLDELEKELEKELEESTTKTLKEEEERNKRATERAQERLQALDKATARQLEMNEILVTDERKRADEEYRIQQEGNQKKLALMDKLMQEALDRGDIDAYLALEQERADTEVEIQTNAVRELMRLRKQDLDDAKKKAEAQKELLKNVASATSSILGTIADLYESDAENSEKNANQIKNLRVAAATIDTISGAIGAFMQASATIPPPTGQIVGAIQAAAITAAGVAQIAKMKSTNVTGSSNGSSMSFPSVASAFAPSVPTEFPQIRSMTSASEEERLNQMASDQRVYILSSDIEASQNQIKVQVDESSF